MKHRIPFRALLALLSVGPIVACQSGGDRPPNLLLITVDTLRPDRLGYNGYSRPTSPTLDRLAASGIVFTRAYSQSGWTLPSMATILTGAYPKDHRATDFHYRINWELPTLASTLLSYDYDTRGYVSHVLLTSRYGFHKGFGHYDSSVLDRGNPHDIETSEELTRLALEDLKDLKEPFFVWVHYFDPHFAYLSHPQWASFGDEDSDRYDQEIAHTDAYIGRLLDFFRQKKLLERTCIVFTADHGEEFGEHGGAYHETCYQEVVRVPLVVSGPGIAPGRNDAIVDQVDLMPTMLGLIGVTPQVSLPGRNLLAGSGGASGGGAAQAGTPAGGRAAGGASGGGQLAERPIFIERDRPPGFRQRAMLLSGLKLVRVEPRDTTLIPEESRTQYAVPHNVTAGTYLYDLASDPGEQWNIAEDDQARTEVLLARLASHFTGRGEIPAEQVTIDEQMRERLRALGYIR